MGYVEKQVRCPYCGSLMLPEQKKTENEWHYIFFECLGCGSASPRINFFNCDNRNEVLKLCRKTALDRVSE